MSYRFKYGDRPLDDYTIQRAVGSGGFGEVYYAVSDGGREVALKYLRQNPESELRGVSHCINLKSPHLVSIFDVKKNADGDYFIIMEYCSGPSLRDLLIAEPNGFPQEKAAFFIREIAKGLAYLHDRGIVHRDLKPGNIFYDDAYVKIGDYGLSKFISVSRHSAQTSSVGTVHYMAPEIGSGNYSRGVDIYALGVMLYEMLLGKVPFEGSSMAEILMKHLTSQPEVDELPKPFTKIIRKALEKDPDDRYQNVNEMVDDLLSVEQVQSSLAGFSPQSLDGAVREAVHADSPTPSPNPPPRPKADGGVQAYAFALDLRDVENLPGRVSKRLEKIDKRFGKRMARLARDVPKRLRKSGDQQARGIGDNAPPPRQPTKNRAKRMIPALLLTCGLVVGTGLLFGANVREEIGGAAAMLIIAMSLGSGLAKKVHRWFGDENLPGWVVSLMSGVVCAPLLFLAGAPLCDYTSLYVGAVGGLLVSLLFANWDKVREVGAEGRLGFGGALWVGFGAAMAGAIIGAIVDEGPHGDHVFLLTGAIAAASVIVVQANCWWLVGSGGPRNPRSGRGTRLNRDGFEEASLGEDDQQGAQAPFGQGGADDDLPPFAVPIDESNGRQVRARAAARHDHRMRNRPERLTATRVFWSFIAFVLMGGAIVGFVSAIVDSSMTDPFQEIVATCGCAAFVIFALSKTTMRKRLGFWRDTLRPFLISLMLFAIGATITGIANGPALERTITTMSDFAGGEVVSAEVRTWRREVPLAACISGLAISSVGLITVLAIRGRRRRKGSTQEHDPTAARPHHDAYDAEGAPQGPPIS